jgi:hypothetical protein
MFPFGITPRNLQELRRFLTTGKVLIEFPQFGEPSCAPEAG